MLHDVGDHRRYGFCGDRDAARAVHVELISLRLPPNRRVLVLRVDLHGGRGGPLAPAVIGIILGTHVPIINRVVVQRHRRHELRILDFAGARGVREGRRRVPFHLVRDRIEIRIEALPLECRLAILRQLAIGRTNMLRNAWFRIPFGEIDIIDPHLIPGHMVRIHEHRPAVFPFEHAVLPIGPRRRDRERVHRPPSLSGYLLLHHAVDVKTEEMLVRFGVCLGPERDVLVFPDAQAQFVAGRLAARVQGARARAECAHVAFRRHVLDAPGIGTRQRVGEFLVITRLEIFVDQIRRTRIDAFVRADEIANAGDAIAGRVAILANHAFATGRTTAIDVGFVLVQRHVVACRDTLRITRIRPARVARTARAIHIVLTGIPIRTGVTRHAAAIDIGLVLILHAVSTRTRRNACHRTRIAGHRRAIAVLRARIAGLTRTALRTTAIDVSFVLVLHAVITRGHGRAFRGIRITNHRRAIRILHAVFPRVTCTARTTTTIDVRLRTVLHAIATHRPHLALHGRRITRIARTIAVLCARATNIAFVAFRTATIDVRFVLILDSIAARWRSRFRTYRRRHPIVADFAIRFTIEQLYPLPTIVRIRRATLYRILVALRRANRGTSVVARTSTTAATTPVTSSTSLI